MEPLKNEGITKRSFWLVKTQNKALLKENDRGREHPNFPNTKVWIFEVCIFLEQAIQALYMMLSELPPGFVNQLYADLKLLINNW